MKIRTLIGKICNSCLFQLLVGIGIFLLLSLGLTGGSHRLAANAPMCYWIVAGVVILLLIPWVLLVILSFVGLIVSIFTAGRRKMAKNEKTYNERRRENET